MRKYIVLTVLAILINQYGFTQLKWIKIECGGQSIVSLPFILVRDMSHYQ